MKKFYFFFTLLVVLCLSVSCDEECPDGCVVELPSPDTSTTCSFTVSHPTRGTDEYTIDNSTLRDASDIRNLPFGFQRDGHASIVGTIGAFSFYTPSPWNRDACNTLSPFYWSQQESTDFYMIPLYYAVMIEFTGLDVSSPDCYPSRDELISHLEDGVFSIGPDPGDVHLIISGRYVGFRSGEPGSYFTDMAVPEQTGTLRIIEVDTESARYNEKNGVFIRFTVDRIDVLDHMYFTPESYMITAMEGRMFLPTE